MHLHKIIKLDIHRSQKLNDTDKPLPIFLHSSETKIIYIFFSECIYLFKKKKKEKKKEKENKTSRFIEIKFGECN